MLFQKSVTIKIAEPRSYFYTALNKTIHLVQSRTDKNLFVLRCGAKKSNGLFFLPSKGNLPRFSTCAVAMSSSRNVDEKQAKHSMLLLQSDLLAD